MAVTINDFKRNVIIEMMMIVMIRMTDDYGDDVTGNRMWGKNVLNISSFIRYICKKIRVYYTTYIIKKEAM